jgi:predicted  nucleic acid-binding Zn-ribbon protein
VVNLNPFIGKCDKCGTTWETFDLLTDTGCPNCKEQKNVYDPMSSIVERKRQLEAENDILKSELAELRDAAAKFLSAVEKNNNEYVWNLFGFTGVSESHKALRALLAKE